MYSPGPLVSRVEVEMNLGWAERNPDLFAQRFILFQTEYPLLEWKHHIDMSRPGFVTLIAYRRECSFESDIQYVKSGAWLREIGG